MALKSEFLNVLEDRGFIHQATDLDALDERLSEGPITAYIGFDATAKSFHVGSLVQIMLLYWLQKTGNRPIVLMGGATTKIGDPSEKDEMRRLLDEGEIRENIKSLVQVFEKAIIFGDEPHDALLLNNEDWIDSLNYPKFLRDFGTYFTVNRMLSFENVRLRFQANLCANPLV